MDPLPPLDKRLGDLMLLQRRTELVPRIHRGAISPLEYTGPDGAQCAGTGPSPARLQMPQSLLLPASPEDEPIGCRTRTRLPMQHISLDDLDALLGEEGDELFDEEGEHYNTFLRVRSRAAGKVAWI